MSEENTIPPTPVALGFTARWIAAIRAFESRQPDALFNDPWAAALAGKEGLAWLEGRQGSVAPIIIRTRYFDDFLRRTLPEEGLRQVVVLGPGLDTRAFRLNWPLDLHWFELDQPDVLDYKQAVLDAEGAQPTCQRTVIGVDLDGEWRQPLLAHGFDPQTPALWLLEGLLFYLPDEAITRILQEVDSLAAPSSVLAFDIVNHITLTSPLTKAWIEMQAQQGAPWLGGLDDPVAFLAELGWTAALTQPGAADAHYGRWTLPVIPVTMADMPHNWYVTGKKG